MYHYTAYGLNFSSEIALDECVPSQGVVSDFTIKSATFRIPALRKTNIQRRGVQAACAIGDHGEYYLHWEGIATFKASAGTLLEVQAYTTDQSTLSLFTVCEAFGLILFQREYFLLHASAVQVGGVAWVFIARPGTGKSTTSSAFVKAGCPLLSDDLTAITFDSEGRPFVQPGYPQVKIWEESVMGLGYQVADLQAVAEGVRKYALHPKDNFSTTRIPLGAFFFLDRARNRPAHERLNPGIFPTESLKHFSLSRYFITGENQIRLFKQSILCAKSAKIYRMRRPNGFAALEKWVESCLMNVQVEDLQSSN